MRTLALYIVLLCLTGATAGYALLCVAYFDWASVAVGSDSDRAANFARLQNIWSVVLLIAAITLIGLSFLLARHVRENRGRKTGDGDGKTGDSHLFSIRKQVTVPILAEP
ncbi:MAG TPA: hypothetical protein VH518_23750 [Tepidisphaeraceae bacterium]|jgi:hypothetical protein